MTELLDTACVYWTTLDGQQWNEIIKVSPVISDPHAQEMNTHIHTARLASRIKVYVICCNVLLAVFQYQKHLLIC